MNVKAGSYVVPADVVSGLGLGNSLAGSKRIEGMFATNPLAIASHFRPFRPPQGPRFQGRLARGGIARTVPIIVAGGEFLVPPEWLLAKWGNLDRAHNEMDRFVVESRKRHKKTLANLPGPKK